MSAPSAVADRPAGPPRATRLQRWRDAGFGLLVLASVAATYWGTIGSTVATASVVGVATAWAMQARLALGRWRAAGLVATSAVLLYLLGAGPRLSGVALVTGLVGAEVTARCTRRSAVLRAGGWTGAAAAAASLASPLVRAPASAAAALGDALGAGIGAALGAPVVLILGPVAEWVFGHTTRLTMSEWLNYDHPLLRDLASKAPGTFQHSVNVGVLADAAAGAIGGDALVAHVGGLYHDVGKIEAPEYFSENQSGANPHDRLDPWESARILRAHVSDGVRLVRKHRMGDRIAAIVQEHHGTGVMSFFLTKAQALGLKGPVQEAYRYDGPKPRSREAAIVMMADQIEATARSAAPADPEACRTLVAEAVEHLRGEGQLDLARLTDRDLTRIQPALTRALQAMHHRRLAYPQAEAPPARRERAGLLGRIFRRGSDG